MTKIQIIPKETPRNYMKFKIYGISKTKRPDGKLIWIHASSVGEFKSVSTIIDRLHKRFTILVTTTTVTASNYAIDHFGSKMTSNGRLGASYGLFL